MSVKRFGDFAQEASPLDGSKLKIEDVVNKEILILGYKLKDSKYAKTNYTQCLTIQFEMNEHRYVLFTGSTILIEQMEKYHAEQKNTWGLLSVLEVRLGNNGVTIDEFLDGIVSHVS